MFYIFKNISFGLPVLGSISFGSREQIVSSIGVPSRDGKIGFAFLVVAR